MEDERLGRLAGDVSSRGFLDRVMDPATGELHLARSGRVWEAIEGARRSGATGAGRLVAVIDAGFDVSLPALARGIHPASRVRQDTPSKDDVDWHGTAVALLIRTVAPEAELLLLDVWKPGGLRQHDVAQALDTAREAGADVVNLSLEFPARASLAPTNFFDARALPHPSREQFLRVVGLVLDSAEPYVEPRCTGACETCASVERLPEDPLVVAASGNDVSQLACPACVRRVLGVGFRRTTYVEEHGVVFTQRTPTESILDLGRAELLVEEPPGFVGTSFAAPLVAGLAALLPDPAALVPLARAGRVFDRTVLELAYFHTHGTGVVPPDVADAVAGGLDRIFRTFPLPHQHPPQRQTWQPCGACCLTVLDWYDVYVNTMGLHGRRSHALDIARIASLLFPLTASVRGNHGFFAEQQAVDDFGGTAEEREVLLREALGANIAAADIAPTVPMYAEARDRVLTELDRLASSQP